MTHNFQNGECSQCGVRVNALKRDLETRKLPPCPDDPNMPEGNLTQASISFRNHFDVLCVMSFPSICYLPFHYYFVSVILCDIVGGPGSVAVGAGGLTKEDIATIMKEEMKVMKEEMKEEMKEQMKVTMGPINRALQCVLEISLDPWENIRSITTENLIKETVPHLQEISEFYVVPKSKYCMVLGPATHCDVICAHIWPACTHGSGLEHLDLQRDDVNNPRNFLRLQRNIEKAFDDKRLYFDFIDVKEGGNVCLRVRLLDPTIQSEEILYNNQTITFSQIEEKYFHHQFVNEKKPFLRLLSLHADKALTKARAMKWIEDEADMTARREKNLALARLSLDEEKQQNLKAFFQSTQDEREW
jgi:hypothetical protein